MLQVNNSGKGLVNKNAVILEINFISTKLVEWRKEKMLTKQCVADYLNMEQANYCRLEKGKSHLDVKLAFKLCKFYNKRSVELNYLFVIGENTPEIELIDSMLSKTLDYVHVCENAYLKKINDILQQQIDGNNQLYLDLVNFFASPKFKNRRDL